MGLRDIGQKLPPGFRFYPSDEELVCHYLYRKVANDQHVVVRNTLVEIDLHTCEPWQLPDVAKLNSEQWYFFSFRDRKYATGFRTNRATTSGYWKATGKDRAVVDPKTRAVVGMRKTLVFYKNRAPNGLKTGWIMHEFRLENPHVPPTEDWVLCRVFHKTSGENSNKLSPQNYMYDSTQNLDYSFSTNEHYSLPIANQNTTTSFYHSSSHHQQYCHEDQNLSSFLGLSELDTSRYFHRISHDDHNIDNEANPSTSHDRNESKFVETKCEDDYRFDMSFDYTNGGQSNLGDDIRFDYDNSSIFI